MSDLNNLNPVAPAEQAGENQQAPVRHRRSQRPHTDVQEGSTIMVETPVHAGNAAPEESNQTMVRIPPARMDQQRNPEAGRSETPRPRALDRVSGQAVPPRRTFGQEEGMTRDARRTVPQEEGAAREVRRSFGQEEGTPREIRRTVEGQGYVRQTPLGRAYDRQVPQKPVARPAVAEKPEEDRETRNLGRVWLILLLVVVLLALLVLGFFLIPDDMQNPLGDFKRMVTGTIKSTDSADPTIEPAADVSSHARFVSMNADSRYVPAVLTFNFETDSTIEDIQLINSEGQHLESAIYQNDADPQRLSWAVQVVFDQPYWGTVRAQVLSEEGWTDLDMSQQVSVTEETILETSTAAPTLQVSNDILDFSASPSQGKAPVNIAFSMTTSLNITNVRLVDDEGNPLEAEANVLVENASNRIWALNYTFTEAYTGAVRAQAIVNGAWTDSNKLVSISVLGPALTAPPVVLDLQAMDTDAPAQEDSAFMDPADVAAMEAGEDVWDEGTEDTVEWEEADWEETVVEEAADENPAPAVTQMPLVGDALPTPEPEPTPTLTPAPEITPAPENAEEVVEEEPETAKLTAVADASADPSLIKTAVIYSGTKKVDHYERPVLDVINMPDADTYCRQPYGVMTFRGSSFRQNAAEGTVSDPSDMEVIWTVPADSVKSNGKTVFYGIGWTGQPLIIKWSKEVREMADIYDEKKSTKALREVIVAGEDGKIYFLDLETGEKTRSVLNVGVPMRGTPSVHALGYPVLSVGQYARKMADKTYDIGMRVYNLLNSKQLFMIDGLDGKLDRMYYDVGSFETSSLYDYNSDTMLSAGTNGMFYVTKLNTTIDRTTEQLTVNPSHVSLKTKASGKSADKLVAVESSMAAYQQYAFYADMGGVLRCVDTSSMTVVWAVDTEDAVEASVALDLKDDGQTLWLYTANTLQNRKTGACQIRRYNAMTGALDWVYEVPVKKNTKTGVTAGAKASPVVGRNGLDGLVYYTVSLATSIDGSAADGVIIALDKETGKMVWQRPLSSYSYSSPVAVYNSDGKGWIIQAASDGTIELMDGLTGEPKGQLKLEGTINGSPAVYKNILVIGTQGKGTSNIYGIELK